MLPDLKPDWKLNLMMNDLTLNPRYFGIIQLNDYFATNFIFQIFHDVDLVLNHSGLKHSDI